MNLDVLHGDVAVSAPGAARYAVDEALHQATSEFFRDSRAWLVDLEPQIEVLPWQTEYPIPMPFGLKLVEPIRLHADGTRLRSEVWGMVEDPLTGDPILRLRGPVSGRLLGGELAVTLGTRNRIVPDRLADMFREAFVYGALSKLLRIPQTQFFAPDLSLMYLARFEEAKERAATRAESGYKHQRTRVVQYGGL
jgi:hypothetical protein